MSQRELSFSAGGNKPKRPPVWTVAQVVRGANRMLEGKFSNLWIEGEVNSLKVAASGHAFFTLTDPWAALPSAMWKAAVETLPFRLENGQKLRCFGRVGIFAKQGRFQFYVDRAEPAGLGARALELEQRKKRLAAEGLFDTDAKRPIPAWPRVIGVVTSQSGAAIHDIVEVARRRCPSRVLLVPAVVQGPDAPRSLVAALRRIATLPEIDVVIFGRGGGSAEDLACFDDERVVRAVAACPVPVVSAIGHEVDISLSDLAADLRAATPSHAAELVVPDREAFVERLEGLVGRLQRGVSRSVLDHRSRLDGARADLAAAGRTITNAARDRFDAAREGLVQQHPRRRVHRDRRRLDALTARLAKAGSALPRHARQRLTSLDHRLVAAGQKAPRPARVRLARLAGALNALSPLAVLQRGYAVVTSTDGEALLDAEHVEVGEALEVRLHRGRLRVDVTHREPEPSSDAADSESSEGR